MAGEWDVVEAKPLSEWDVVSTAPAGNGRPGGDIPGAEGEPARAAAARAAYKPPTFGEKVKGAVETALELVSQMTGGALGMVGGTVGGVAGAVRTGQFGTQQGARGIEEQAVAGAQRGTTAARGALQSMLGMDEAPASPTGQEMIDSVGQVMGQAPALVAGPRGVVGLSGQSSGLRPAARAAGDVVRAGTDAATGAVRPAMSPGKLALAQKAQGAGMQLNLHHMGENKFVRMVGEWAEGIPLSWSKGKQRQEAFNAGLARAIDPDLEVTALTPEVFDSAMTKAGETIGEISARTPVPRETLGDLASVARRETPDVQGVVKGYVDDIAQVADANGGVVPGETFRKLRTEAAAQSRTTPNGDLRRTLGNLVKRMDDALAEHAVEGDMPALLDARRRYAIGSTVMPLVAKSADGNISPAALLSAVTRDRAGKNRMARGKGGDLGDYAQIGQQFLKEQASSGTAERNLVYRAATDATAASKMALTWPAAVVYNLVGPRIARRMVDGAARRAAPVPEGPFNPSTSRGFQEMPNPPPEPGPLGDLTPDWETAPGAAPAQALELAPAEGLVPALGDEVVTTGPRKDLRNGLQIPAVEGRPDLPDAMVVGKPAEVAADAATGAAMQTPEAELARNGTRVAVSGDPALAEVERLRAASQSPEVQKVLDAHAEKVAMGQAAKAADAKRKADAAELRRAADLTIDPELAAALRQRAEKLDKPEKVPKGDAKELASAPAKPVAEQKKPVPKGEATEVPVEVVEPENPDVPVGEATEIAPEVVEVDTAANQKFEAGKTYVDAKGNKAVYQADGTWKEIP